MEDALVKDEQHRLVGDSARETAFKKAEAVRVKNEKNKSENFQIQRRREIEAKLEEKRKEYKEGLEYWAKIWFNIPKEAFLVFEENERVAIENDVLERAKKSWRVTKVVASVGMPSLLGLIVYLGLKFTPVLFLLLFINVIWGACLGGGEVKKLITNHKLLNSENPIKEIEKEFY